MHPFSRSENLRIFIRWDTRQRSLTECLGLPPFVDVLLHGIRRGLVRGQSRLKSRPKFESMDRRISIVQLAPATTASHIEKTPCQGAPKALPSLLLFGFSRHGSTPCDRRPAQGHLRVGQNDQILPRGVHTFSVLSSLQRSL